MFDVFKLSTFLKKTFSKKEIRLILSLIVLYFLTRLINLGKFPIFTDEGIYIHWAKIAWHDASWRFISLTDGKQPLHTWGMIPFLKFFPNNPLLAGRLFSVATGFVALSGVFTLLYYLFGKKTALYGSFFYVFTPFFLFYDRMALIDSGVNAGFIWIFFFSILLARTLRLDVALLSGMVSGISLLAKSSSKIFVVLSVFAPVLFLNKERKIFKQKVVNFAALYAISGIIALVIYNVQRLSPFLHFVGEKNKTFIMTLGQFIETPFRVVFSNLPMIPLDVLWESAFILPLIGFLGLFLLFKKNRNLFFYFLFWIVLPYIVISLFAIVVYPRYLIFFGTLFLFLAAYFITSQKNKQLKKIILVLYILSIVYFDFTVLFDHKNIPFPPVDRGQYIESVSAGWGVKEIISFAREKSKEKPTILLAEGNFGVVGDMLEGSLGRDDNITVKGYWPLTPENLVENQKELVSHNVYVVFSHRNDFPPDLPIKFIQRFIKPGGKSSFYLFELTPK